jgi:DNA primase
MISYKELKQHISIVQVLQKFGVKTEQKGKQLVTSCPKCGGVFKVSKEKNCFKCFSPGCSAKGNILDFVAIF